MVLLSSVFYMWFLAYGQIDNVETTGASWATSQQDKLGYSGVQASHKMAEIDFQRMSRYKAKILSVGQSHEIEPALIAAIISRESRAGNQLKDGWGDRGNAWGLMQVDKNYHTHVGAWDSEAHLSQATGILVSFIKKIRNKFPSWTTEQQLKGGISAYNMGDGNVHSYGEVDKHTTGGDYSNDVTARAQWYSMNGY